MDLNLIFWGFVAKFITGLDGVLTRIPVLSSLTKSRAGIISFSIGTIIATALTITVAIIFSSFINDFPHSDQVLAGLIFALAIAVMFNIFRFGVKDHKDYTKKNLLFVMGIGLLVSFATLLDDTLVMLPLFLGHLGSAVFAIIGITIATLLNIFIVIHFSSRLYRVKYKKEISSLALMVLAVLVWFGIV